WVAGLLGQDVDVHGAAADDAALLNGVVAQVGDDVPRHAGPAGVTGHAVAVHHAAVRGGDVHLRAVGDHVGVHGDDAVFRRPTQRGGAPGHGVGGAGAAEHRAVGHLVAVHVGKGPGGVPRAVAGGGAGSLLLHRVLLGALEDHFADRFL